MKEREFDWIYKLYKENFYNNHDKEDTPVCYEEFVDNDLPYYECEYKSYLEGMIEDESVDVKEIEDFYTWIEEELKEKRDEEGNLK